MADKKSLAEAFFTIVNSRRSVRKFTDEPVPREVLERIVAAGIEAPSGGNAQQRQYVIVDDPAVMEKVRAASPALKTAPAAIVIVMDPSPTKWGEFWVQDASAAMENMLLAAVALGYAGCWVEGAVRRSEDELRKLLGIPEKYRVWSMLPVGRPAESPARPPKSSPADVTHHNRFGGK
jgi:nitroreductase